MTIVLPEYARSKPGYLVWKYKRKFRAWQHGRKRNPDCNENRRYRDDITFTSGPHKHQPPMVGIRKDTGERIEVETVLVPFKPFRFDGPTYSDGLSLQTNSSDKTLLQTWNWFDIDE